MKSALLLLSFGYIICYNIPEPKPNANRRIPRMPKYEVNVEATILKPKEIDKTITVTAPDAETAQEEALLTFRDELLKKVKGESDKILHIGSGSVRKKNV